MQTELTPTESDIIREVQSPLGHEPEDLLPATPPLPSVSTFLARPESEAPFASSSSREQGTLERGRLAEGSLRLSEESPTRGYPRDRQAAATMTPGIPPISGLSLKEPSSSGPSLRQRGDRSQQEGSYQPTEHEGIARRLRPRPQPQPSQHLPQGGVGQPPPGPIIQGSNRPSRSTRAPQHPTIKDPETRPDRPPWKR